MTEGSADLEIIFQDEYIIAVNKPNGLLVHRSSLANDAHDFAIQRLRNQVGYHVYPVHRLDRKTSGVLLFCKEKERVDDFFNLFRQREVSKKYFAIVRGFCDDNGIIEYNLKNAKGKLQEAITEYVTIDRFELPIPSGKHSSSRYSLVDLKPLTGRMHQLRRHMAHIFHPIIGDRPHGCNKQNKMWLERFGINNMLLHARQINFCHPVTLKSIEINASLSPSFLDAQELLSEYKIEGQ